MPRARTRFLGYVLTACLMAPATAFAQGPWNVTITPTLNPLPAGFCSAIQLTIVDASGRDAPRNPRGLRVTIADFDITTTGDSVLARQIDAFHWDVCACQGAVAGSTATVAASYPARSVDVSARVPDVSVQRSATFTIAPPKGPNNPPGCAATASPTPIKLEASTRAPLAPPYSPGPVAVTLGLSANGSWYEPSPVSVNLALSAQGTWYEPAPVNLSLSLSANGTWYEAAPVTVTFDLAASGSWIERGTVPRPLQPVAPAR